MSVNSLFINFYYQSPILYGPAYLKVFLKNGPSPASFSFIFVSSNKHYNFYHKNMRKILCPSSKWRRDLNPWPSEQESPPITTRPGLPPTYLKVIVWIILKNSQEINLSLSLLLQLILVLSCGFTLFNTL